MTSGGLAVLVSSNQKNMLIETKDIKKAIQERQLQKDMLENDLINDLREAKNEFTKIYLAELIVEALGDEAEEVRNEMEFFIKENREEGPDVSSAYENPNQGLWKDTYDPEMI